MRSTWRLFQVMQTLCKYRLDELVPVEDHPALQKLMQVGPWRFYPRPETPVAQRLREALHELGPIFIKFGQLLSTRPDLIPAAFARELAQLQDQVPPFPGDEAVAIIEEALGQPTRELFSEFSVTPLASASIAQVHAARLPDGRQVVTKVIRPGIESVIRRDTRLLRSLAAWMERLIPESRRLHPQQVVRDYELTLFDELDMMKEAANTSQLRRNFLNSPLIYIPEVVWEMTRKPVLVMERIHGIPISDIDALRSANVDLAKLAERGVEIFFTQVFRDSFFHADMHPGNIFVDASQPSDPRYIAIDCGIMGSLSPRDQSYLARNLLAFFHQDYRQVAQLHIDSGWIPAHTRVNEFEAAIRSVCEPFFNRPLKEISFGQFLVRLFQTARRFDMEVQPQLVLLQKTLLNIEGLGRQLYPDLDLWQTGLPYLERWMQERIGPPGLIKTLSRQLPQWIEQSPDLPGLIYQALEKAGEPQQAAPPHPGKAPTRSRWQWLGPVMVAIALLSTLPGWESWWSRVEWPSLLILIIGAYLWFTAGPQKE